MRVVFVTPECAPLVKAGGLGDVSASLPQALRRLGHEVDVLLPGYSDALAKVGALQDEERCAHLGFEARLRRAGALLFLDCAPLYARGGGPYPGPGGRAWAAH